MKMLSLTLMVIISLATGIAQAADQGPRRYAEGAFDAATGTYTVVKGDELAAIAERFGVTVAELKAQNKLASDEIKSDQKLVMATGAAEAQPAGAIQITGVLGSPSATTTIPGNQLPPPDPNFGGVIKEKASESTAWWAPRVVPPKQAPNVLLIMLDDAGYAAPATFGGVIPTPALDRIAKDGLRYTNFHTTSLCSPTRAALITGRNHHVAGFGTVGEVGTGFPGYNSIIRKENGTIGTIMKENGYATSWFGKNHNTPSYQATQAGPFDQWPNGMGFEYFYGFMGGDASQWQPNLYRNTTPIYPFEGNPGWNLTTAMADEAIQYMRNIKSVAPDKPFLVYYGFIPTKVRNPPQEFLLAIE